MSADMCVYGSNIYVPLHWDKTFMFCGYLQKFLHEI